ncbi:MAG: division/cell wall cluster transcriptional repressor MraZ [Deltaproteobacteria bacterium]|nr:division/cell wall cluster transcriptional repressor MraZ [Deltaproteobacteria bacterium]
MEIKSHLNNDSLIKPIVGGIESSSFKGTYEHLLDDKGRVSLPSSFRQVLAQKNISSVVITNFITDGARCLDGFTISAWQDFETKLKEKSRFDPQLRKLENFYFARAVECSVDAAGRINIPHQLRTYAGLEKEIVFTASLHGFRIWEKRVWEFIFREAEAALLEDPSLYANVDI